jgi:hypothetical protein
VNPALKLRSSEVTLAEFLAANPALAPAIERAKGKIAVRARVEADALASNLKIIRKRLVKPRVDSGGVKARAKFAPAAFGLNVVGSAPGNLTEQHNEKDENMDHHRSLSRLRS